MALRQTEVTHASSSKSLVVNEYVIYEEGELNLILSVPHGGLCRPKSIPNRVPVSCVKNNNADVHQSAKDPSVSVCVKNDVFTVHLARLLADSLERFTGKRPYLVINRLHRIKLDCNRSISEGTLGVPEAVTAWKAYHDAIATAKAAIGGRGLLLDIHGHSHSENWIELGYGIRRERLNLKCYESSDTSIRYLHEWHRKHREPKLINRLICGHESFGGLLENAGYDVVPSTKHPSPNNGNYFSGGYSILTHGSKYGGCFDAIQIESPVELRTLAAKRWQYANCLAKVIAEFLSLHYSA